MEVRRVVGRVSGSLPRSTDSSKWREEPPQKCEDEFMNRTMFHNPYFNEACSKDQMRKGRILLEMNQIHSYPHDFHLDFKDDNLANWQHFTNFPSLDWDNRHGDKSGNISKDNFTRKKTRSTNFYEDGDQLGEFEGCISEPMIAFQMLLHQNKKQKIKLNKIQENFSSFKAAEMKSNARNAKLSHSPYDHVGCKLDMLGKKIEARKLVLESFKQQLQQNAFQGPFPVKFLDPNLLKETLLIDKVSFFPEF